MRQHVVTIRFMVLSCLALPIALGCGDDDRKKKFGDFCAEDSDCESGICFDNACLDPDGDLDGDGLKNGIEKNLLGTDLSRADSDGDGFPDGEEVGDINAPADRDGDGLIDALESRLPTADGDGDCIPDEYDANNAEYTNDMAKLVELHCVAPGVCETGRDAVIATCSAGVPQCDFTQVADWEADESLCDGLDNDCDGDTDRDLSREDGPECPAVGVCGAVGAVRAAVCTGGQWVCVFAGIPDHQDVETLCDDLDNDCDGGTDEDLTGGACQNENEHGTCDGTLVCDLETGGTKCDGPIAEAEVCDELDNNCDGDTDEDLSGVECKSLNKYGACIGTTVCDLSSKTAVCMAPMAAFDECDGLDNDCDGVTDNNDICNKGARILGRITGVPQRTAAGVLAATTGQPIVGARIVAATGEACAGTVPPEAATDIAYTLEDGTFILPIIPGYWCLFIQAEGWEQTTSWEIMLEEGDAFPVEIVMAPTGTQELPVSICGRTVEYLPIDASKAVGDTSVGTSQFTPVGGVAVTLKQPDVLLGETVSDEHGYFCFAGIEPADLEGYLMLLGSRAGYYPGSTEVPVNRGVLMVTYLFMEPEPTEFSTCMMDDFESGGTDVTLAAAVVGGYWEPSEHANGVGWNQTWSWLPTNAFLGSCAALPADEKCQPGTTGCALCDPQVPVAGCIGQPGQLPSPASGYSAWYFGNIEMGAYMPWETKCEETGPMVVGSLASPWFEGWRVVEMRLDFKSAWEVEAYNPDADKLVVETQTSMMSETDTWNVVGTLKPTGITPATDPLVGWSSGGVDRAPTWQNYTFDLTPFAGETMRIRFRFDSVDGNRNAFRGWMIDDVAVTGRGCYWYPAVR